MLKEMLNRTYKSLIIKGTVERKKRLSQWMRSREKKGVSVYFIFSNAFIENLFT